MSPWKFLVLPLAVLVPLLAYVFGTLAMETDRPTRPEPVILQDRDDPPEPAPSPRLGRDNDDGRAQDGDREPRVDDSSGEDDDDDDEPRVVVPRPTQVEEDDDDRGQDEDEDDDTTEGGDDSGDDDGDDD